VRYLGDKEFNNIKELIVSITKLFNTFVRDSRFLGNSDLFGTIKSLKLLMFEFIKLLILLKCFQFGIPLVNFMKFQFEWLLNNTTLNQFAVILPISFWYLFVFQY
jgi:dynactin complex subunit